MKKTSEYLLEKYGKWGWMGQRAHDAVGINHILPLDFIISCQHGEEVTQYFREKDVFSAEKQIGVRKNWSNEDLKSSLKGAMGREIYARWESSKENINLLCYRSVKRLEEYSAKHPGMLKIYAAEESLKRHFDSKILLHRNMKKLSLPEIRGTIKRPGEMTFKDIQKEFSVPFVVQFPYGSSGSSTFIINNEKDYNDLIKNSPQELAVIREYLDGFSLNANAIIVSTSRGAKTLPSAPSVQITGLRECSGSPSTYCGNDYALANDIDPDILRQVESLLKRVGSWMAESGYRGIFGMDFIVKRGMVYAMEINPRFQNSTSLYTVLSDIENPGGGVLFLLHIAEFLQKEDKRMKEFVEKFPEEDLKLPVSGSQVIIHNRKKRTIVTGEFTPGVYRLKGKNLIFINKGTSCKDCRERSDVLITCGVPKKNTPAEANAPLCKVQMRRNILTPGTKRELTKEGKIVVEEVYKKLALKDVSKMEFAQA